MNVFKKFSTSLTILAVLTNSTTVFACPPPTGLQGYTNKIDPEHFHQPGEDRFIWMGFKGEHPVKVYLQPGGRGNEDLNYSVTDFALTFFKIKGIESPSVETGTSFGSEHKYNYFLNGTVLLGIYKHVVNDLGIDFSRNNFIVVFDKPQGQLESEMNLLSKTRSNPRKNIYFRHFIAAREKDRAIGEFISKRNLKQEIIEARKKSANVAKKVENNTKIDFEKCELPSTEPLPTLW